MASPHSQLTHPKYRPDIDGLRAIAVLSVVAFHAFPGWVNGGFVGVDIFFVISGFLISTIIFESLEKGKFSFSEFYARRVRRIFPALALVLIVSYGAGVVFLYEDELALLGKHIASGVGFVSNLTLLKESGYFDVAAETKPLLHLWSLGIEEQFYIFWPLLAWLGWRRKIGFLALTLVIFAASFAFNAVHINARPVATFYLPFTRFWELLAGAILAWTISHKKDVVDQFTSKYGEALSLTGLACLVLSLILITKSSLFPGFWAALPVLGAVLVILSGARASYFNSVLSSRVFVWFGLISYPLYLWHWPLLSFAIIVEGKTPSAEYRALALVLAIVLAWLTYWFIEIPVRGSRNNRLTVSVLSVLMIAIGLLGLKSYVGDLETLKVSISKRFTKMVAGTKYAEGRSASVMLVGDSHADHLFSGLYKALGGDIYNQSAPGCIPFYNVDRYDNRSIPGACSKAMNKALLRFEQDAHFQTIVLASMGPVYLTGEAFKNTGSERVAGLGVVLETNKEIKDRWLVYELGMRDTLTKLTNTGKHVVFVMDVPELGVEPKSCISFKREIRVFGSIFPVRAGKSECRVPRADYDTRTHQYNLLIKKVLTDYPKVAVFDPTPLFCDTEYCYGTLDGKALYKDPDHLSDFGSEYVAKWIEPLITNAR